ncbi:MAG TPA: hypothetical protein VGC43_03830 [Luteimonas sp.]
MDFTTRNSGLGWAFGALLAFGVFGAAHAQASPIEVSSVAYQEVEVVAADGTRSIKLEPAARIAPGGVVVYEITYHNEAAQPATDVAINNPVARELVYLDASVAPSAVSVDGGKRFAPLSELTVTGADGKPRPAQPADVTHLRWTIASVAPDAGGKVSFRARVK